MIHSQLLLCAIAAAAVLSTSSADKVTILHEWVSVNYTWQNPAQMSTYLANGGWVPGNNVITGLKFFNDAAYVTVPRWRTGVPSTMNRVDVVDGVPLLTPYPSWQFNDPTDPAALHYTQSMEITPDGVMWMLDVGRLYIFDAVVQPVNAPPKLILFDIVANQTLQTFLFPDDVAPYASSFLNDLVLDMTDGFAYISDAGGAGGIVVYDRTSNSARRFADASTAADMSVNMTINGVYYPTIATPEDGIALSPDRSRLFYCALRGQTLYSLPTAALKNFALTNAQLSAQVTTHGYKPPSDGMTFANSGTLFFGSLTGDAVLQWDPDTPLNTQAVLASDTDTMQWADTFAFAGPGRLAYTTNRLQRYFAGTMDFSGASGPNMRIITVPVQGNSYLVGQAPYRPGGDAPSGRSAADTALITGLGVSLGLCAAALLAVLAVLGRQAGWFRRVGGPASRSSAEATTQPFMASY
jgi:sugar lactone lactonase YvrE